MSRWTLPYKVGVVMALAAFVIGITAANALAWPGGEPEKPTTPKHQDQDKNKGHKDDDDDDDQGKGGHEKPKPQPTNAPAGQPTPPAPTAAPPGPTPAPVVSQGVPPPAPEQPVDTEALPPEQRGVPESPVVAQAQPEAGASPAASRNELAKTGLDPALIALLGAMCLGGGGLLFRRALARN